MLQLAAFLFALLSSTTAQSPLIGRWDVTIHMPSGDRPSWLEIRRSGRQALVGDFVGIVGSVRPIARIETSGDSLRFAIPAQWEDGTGDLVLTGRLEGERLSGSMVFPDGKRYEWTAVRAPALRRGTPEWGAPIRLIRANDLGGWRTVSGEENQWQVEKGVLRSPRSGANLATERNFDDFKLHVEFRYPPEGNSGIYLRGRHEVQIQDDAGKPPENDRFGAIYGFIAPSETAARPAGEWQSYDITLVGRTVTVVANGRTVICDRDIPGITGGALDSNEGAPGPLLLQGDHGPIEFRNIIITPAK
jgi:hypothetical protein